MKQDQPGPRRVGRWRLAGFAAGDFAFNLYWQSAMLYLLFYYTDALGLGVETAAAIYFAASVWDGIISFAVGMLVDRHAGAGRYRLALVGGAVPLGLAFVATYAPPPVTGVAATAFVIAGHLLFRTAYACVNIPYLAMSARVSADDRDRSFVAGLRMLAGTLAAVVVALGTVPLGRMLMQGDAGPRAFLGAAWLFAAIATLVLVAVGWTFRDAVAADAPAGPVPSIAASLRLALRNRAFVTLAGAMVAMIVATTVLNKSVLYYFKYAVGDEGAGQLALASMMAVSAAAVPAWMGVARGIGVRQLWFVAVALCGLGLIVFAAADLTRAGAMQLFLIAMQASTVGLHFAFWAMLPDAVDYGQRVTGVRVEGTLFGLAALLQRVAIGIATALIGLSFGQAGYVANVAQAPETLGAMRLTIALVPLACFALSGLVMAFSPLRPQRS
jgi:GPH family glycoside/pentoside/hexuronide:cation symporter